VYPSELIAAVRRRNGLSQRVLARRAGTSQPVVSAYEHGRRDPGFETLRRLVAAAGERLVIDAVRPGPALPPPESLEEHERRLLDVLSIADAVPPRKRNPKLDAPRLVSH
jgi:transcriptional regulator with XRE-family HTH domain